jgi:deazaflavin-dependent oxidoreductase (nitroreductase family)
MRDEALDCGFVLRLRKGEYMPADWQRFAGEDFCYLSSTGRMTGRTHTIEIWFALDGPQLYMLAGNHGSDWVRNIKRTPAVTVRLGDATYAGAARVVEDAGEDAAARRLVLAKYQPGYGEDLSEWGRTSLTVAVDLAA